MAFVLQADADVIVSTNFTGRTIVSPTATITDYTLNGVASPGNWTVVDAGSLFTTVDATDHFAVQDNPPTWSVTIPLTVGASAIDLDDVTINFESFNNAGLSKVLANYAPANNVTVEIRDSLNFVLATQNLGQVPGNTADYWIGIYNNTSFSTLTLAAGQTYSLKITTGGESGNNLGIDSFVINGTFPVTSDIQLTITPNGANYDFSWNSQNGKVYGLRTSTDLATPIAEWPIYNDGVNPSYDNILPSGTGTNTLSAVVPIGSKRFFAVAESDP